MPAEVPPQYETHQKLLSLFRKVNERRYRDAHSGAQLTDHRLRAGPRAEKEGAAPSMFSGMWLRIGEAMGPESQPPPSCCRSPPGLADPVCGNSKR